MNQEQPLEALHDDEGECNRKALRLAAVECLGTGTMDVVCRDNLGQWQGGDVIYLYKMCKNPFMIDTSQV